ncbi:hypothetical protein G7K_3231-t1 [Saitoella complicata NRRL Y-17804]|uniref:Uncharacterized protein n=1 Tax=Saitoella complicata (strain BCRC 22490 / CBS 7301 / JCM 7358 / NBRC 10748 / NRRL Y-17804) TaxID=698492 RepID=A0A0E9NGR1_SAICN|nr:hypothetical protein G7K_3231-t1 [Saitoella complicata NRRL Y-17804]
MGVNLFSVQGCYSYIAFTFVFTVVIPNAKLVLRKYIYLVHLQPRRRRHSTVAARTRCRTRRRWRRLRIRTGSRGSTRSTTWSRRLRTGSSGLLLVVSSISSGIILTCPSTRRSTSSGTFSTRSTACRGLLLSSSVVLVIVRHIRLVASIRSIRVLPISIRCIRIRSTTCTPSGRTRRRRSRARTGCSIPLALALALAVLTVIIPSTSMTTVIILLTRLEFVLFVRILHSFEEVLAHLFCALDALCVRAGDVEEHGFVGFAADGLFDEAGALTFDLNAHAGFALDVFDVGTL